MSGNETLFISDSHLSGKYPDITANFIHFIKTRASKARVLYILGDLFELWLGDDDPATELSAVFEALIQLQKQTKVFFLSGNRDFLVGQQLAQTLGFELLTEPTIIQLNQQATALLHGDILCTDDIEYQNFRQQVRSKAWQQAFLAKPLAERQQIAQQMRDTSKTANQEKSEYIMDVNQQSVLDFFQRHQVTQMIHGHTHRPAVHHYQHNQQSFTRYVLGDWQPDASYLSCTDNGIQLVDSRVK